ncbi:MAG: hypothetical protein AAF479_15435 [Pseudomonadota bacterium]
MTPVDPALLSSLPQTICTAIAARLPDLRECEPHAGRFDLKEIRTFATTAPAVRVALLGIDQGAEQGGPAWEHPVRLAAFIVTTDKPLLTCDVAAITIAQELVTLINGQNWGSDCLGLSERVRASNLYSSGTRSQGIALWAVDWTHKVQLHRAIASSDPVPTEIYAAGLEPDGEPVQVTGDVP